MHAYQALVKAACLVCRGVLARETTQGQRVTTRDSSARPASTTRHPGRVARLIDIKADRLIQAGGVSIVAWVGARRSAPLTSGDALDGKRVAVGGKDRGFRSCNFHTPGVSSKPVQDNCFARFSRFEKAQVDDWVRSGSPVSTITAIDEKGRE